MTKATKLTRFTMAGMMVCSMALTTLTSVSAVTPTITSAATKTDENLSDKLPSAVTVKVHKLKFLDADSTPQQNTGAEMDYTGATELPGVKFNLYNIRELVDSEVKKLMDKNPNLSEEAAIKQAVTNISHNWASMKGSLTPINTVDTDPDGIAQFEDVETKTGDKYNIYLAEEVPGTANANMFISLPLIFGMPIKSGDKFFKVVNLYAKNSAVEKTISNLGDGDSSDNKVYNYAVGEEIHYDARVNIPGNISQKRSDESYLYNKLNIKDQMTQVGTTFKQIDKITVGDDDVTALFDAVVAPIITKGDATNKAGFEYNIDFETQKQDELSALLAAIAGKQVKFTYTVAINQYAVPTKDIGNVFNVTLDDESIVANAKDVETGGFKFTKIDSNDATKLAGAVFKISRGEGDNIEYAKFDNHAALQNPNGIYTAENITWDKTGTTFETGSNGTNRGNLQFSGLESGLYKLEEIKSPDGYAKLANPIPFTIEKGKEGLVELDQLHANVENTPTDGVLPITGSMGIAAFLIVGTAAMGPAVMIKKRRA